MEYYGYEQEGFMEELLAMRSSHEPWPPGLAINDDFSNINGGGGWINRHNELNYWTDNSMLVPQTFEEGYSSNFTIDNQTLLNCSFNELYSSFRDELSPPPEFTDSSYNNNNNNNTKFGTPPFPSPEDLSIMEDDVDQLSFLENCLQKKKEMEPCKMEPSQLSAETAPLPVDFSIGSVGQEKRNKSKKISGQPSKNLMAERRRRKRLNDRLSMLRSVVPKISKMDRTSILGDTIDYMKELLERINQLQEEMEMDKVGSSSNDQPSLMNIFKDSKPNELLVRNSPKFEVERRNRDTRIEICCAGGKQGLLLSTLTTLEALGLEIQQCVISCFANDFSVQASCSEELEQREILTSEDVKQALFRNAGYGGRCL